MTNTEIEEQTFLLYCYLELAVVEPEEFAECVSNGLTQEQLGEEFGPLLEEQERRRQTQNDLNLEER